MKYYITNADGEVVAKFDGSQVTLKDGHERHTVEEVDELSEIVVGEWDSDYER